MQILMTQQNNISWLGTSVKYLDNCYTMKKDDWSKQILQVSGQLDERFEKEIDFILSNSKKT
tara:strand:+ start:20413 stop:20598 length:186 start_codon:yes stop_codon:yes gene_type:complete